MTALIKHRSISFITNFFQNILFSAPQLSLDMDYAYELLKD